MPRKKASATLSQKIYESLLNKLLRRELLPGEIINRRTVAEEFGVSIAPVLEAMVQLEAEGLLTTIPRKGTQVRIIRQEEIADQLVLREAIECEAARYYCGEPVIANETELKELGDAIDNSNTSAVDLWKCEIAFHRKLIELSECRSLLRAFQQAMHLGTLCAINYASDLHPNNPEGNHRQLVDRLKTSDPNEAERFMRQHLQGGKKVLFHRQEVRQPLGDTHVAAPVSANPSVA